MIGLIIAAGEQTRFRNTTLKCMMPYENSDTLTINIKTMLKYCRQVRVYTNPDTFEIIASHIIKNFSSKNDNIDVIKIESGKGCGHAVFTALSDVMPSAEPIIIKWGDAIHDSLQYYNIFNTVEDSDLFIPCEFIYKPYTSLICNNTTVYNILMKDEIPKFSIGWHDLSIFYIPNPLKFVLKIPMIFFTEENIFLKSILKMDIIIKIIKTNLESKSYNTIEEFYKI